MFLFFASSSTSTFAEGFQYTWNRDLALQFHLRNDDDVRALQRALKRDGTSYQQKVNGNFTVRTKNDVIRFQRTHGIKEVAKGRGYVGPATRLYLNQVYSATSEQVSHSPTIPQNACGTPGKKEMPSTSSLIPPKSVQVTSCREIQQPGNYILSKDLASPLDATCLDIHDTSDVFLDCNGHSLTQMLGEDHQGPLVSFRNVSRFSFSNCIASTVNNTPRDARTLLYVSQSNHGVIEKNSFQIPFSELTNLVEGADVADLVIRNNFFQSSYQQRRSRNVVLESNTFIALPGRELGAAQIVSTDGSNNTIRSNLFDGMSDGVLANVIGFDDAIVIQDESGDTIECNDIKNYYDAGIETLGVIRNTKFLRNTIANVPFGIGAWYWNSWSDNIVSDNTVSSAERLFSFYRAYALRTKNSLGVNVTDDAVYFTNNVFMNNTLSQRSGGHESSYFFFSRDFDLTPNLAMLERAAKPSDYILSNNLLKNNDFGTGSSPFLMPGLMFVDGGGNKCLMPNPMPEDFPLRCEP